MPRVSDSRSATDLLAWADAVMVGSDDLPAGLWQQATALLGRQALEHALDRLWASRAPELQGTPARVQLLCLASYVGDPDLVGRVNTVWWNLTNACHHHLYELAPTAVELRRWLEDAAEVVDALENAPGAIPSSSVHREPRG